jgi:hypothetical protein
MPRRTLRWLSPPDGERWLGTHEAAEVAQVWPDGLVGNQVEQWNWLFTTNRKSGYLEGTGDDDRDLYAAQDCASTAYFET